MRSSRRSARSTGRTLVVALLTVLFATSAVLGPGRASADADYIQSIQVPSVRAQPNCQQVSVKGAVDAGSYDVDEVLANVYGKGGSVEGVVLQPVGEYDGVTYVSGYFDYCGSDGLGQLPMRDFQLEVSDQYGRESTVPDSYRTTVSAREATTTTLSGHKSGKKLKLHTAVAGDVQGPVKRTHVTLQRKAHGLWHSVARASTGGSGHATFTVKRHGRHAYRAVTATTSTDFASTSPGVKL